MPEQQSNPLGPIVGLAVGAGLSVAALLRDRQLPNPLQLELVPSRLPRRILAEVKARVAARQAVNAAASQLVTANPLGAPIPVTARPRGRFPFSSPVPPYVAPLPPYEPPLTLEFDAPGAAGILEGLGAVSDAEVVAAIRAIPPHFAHTTPGWLRLRQILRGEIGATSPAAIEDLRAEAVRILRAEGEVELAGYVEAIGGRLPGTLAERQFEHRAVRYLVEEALAARTPGAAPPLLPNDNPMSLDRVLGRPSPEARIRFTPNHDLPPIRSSFQPRLPDIPPPDIGPQLRNPLGQFEYFGLRGAPVTQLVRPVTTQLAPSRLADLTEAEIRALYERDVLRLTGRTARGFAANGGSPIPGVRPAGSQFFAENPGGVDAAMLRAQSPFLRPGVLPTGASELPVGVSGMSAWQGPLWGTARATLADLGRVTLERTLHGLSPEFGIRPVVTSLMRVGVARLGEAGSRLLAAEVGTAEQATATFNRLNPLLLAAFTFSEYADAIERVEFASAARPVDPFPSLTAANAAREREHEAFAPGAMNPVDRLAVSTGSAFRSMGAILAAPFEATGTGLALALTRRSEQIAPPAERYHDALSRAYNQRQYEAAFGTGRAALLAAAGLVDVVGETVGLAAGALGQLRGPQPVLREMAFPEPGSVENIAAVRAAVELGRTLDAAESYRAELAANRATVAELNPANFPAQVNPLSPRRVRRNGVVGTFGPVPSRRRPIVRPGNPLGNFFRR